jgi:XTP/dITP diphosphohydrolase
LAVSHLRQGVGGPRLLVATTNPNKVREIKPLLADVPIEVITLADLKPVPEPEETCATFWENARIKALAYSEATGEMAVAEDSGLEIEALGGEPGVHSAYYAGREGTREERDVRNNQKILSSLGEDRKAYYACIMVYLRRTDDPRPLVAEGIWRGEIARAPRGQNGFGYDPLFFIPALGKTAAELAPEHKNRISHRGIALQKLLGLLGDQA